MEKKRRIPIVKYSVFSRFEETWVHVLATGEGVLHQDNVKVFNQKYAVSHLCYHSAVQKVGKARTDNPKNLIKKSTGD